MKGPQIPVWQGQQSLLARVPQEEQVMLAGNEKLRLRHRSQLRKPHNTRLVWREHDRVQGQLRVEKSNKPHEEAPWGIAPAPCSAPILCESVNS